MFLICPLSEFGKWESVKLSRTLAEARAEELISFRTDTWEFAMLINTLILAQVTGVAALVYVWGQNEYDRLLQSSCKMHKYFYKYVYLF